MNLKMEYETDFNLWLEHHVELLRNGDFKQLDVEHLIEELESMGARDKRELISHLKILIAHLLKWQFQLFALREDWREFKGDSWNASIIEQRSQIDDQLESSPSLKPYLSEAIELAYPKAVALAAQETKLPVSRFPHQCPYSARNLLDKNFYPESTA